MNEASGRIYRAFAVAWLALAMTALAQGQDSSDTERAAENPAAEEKALDPFFRKIDPARLQRVFDRVFGFDSGEASNRPRAPELGEPVFFDLTRPLGDRKYGNELNYLFNASTGIAPGLQVIEYEYAFADWRAAEIDLSYYNGNLEILTPFYQRTLGVGRRQNWVHGYQVSPELYLRSGFVGGSAVYVFGWKPEKESKFSSLSFLGANRTLIGGFHPTPTGTQPVDPGERVYGSWRPTINVDVFYEITEKFTLGFEADQFLRRGKSGEYLDFPFLTYKPGEHAYFQLGGGFYRFESRDQFTVFLHLNFINSSNRKPVEDKPEETRPDQPGPIRRCLAHFFGDR